MAFTKLSVENINTFPHYLGVSSDTKPSKGIRVGEYLQETDTRALFQWDGKDWNQINDVSKAPASDFENQSLDQGRQIIKLLKKITDES